jgi:Putative MetA-pathway of phenol degradation
MTTPGWLHFLVLTGCFVLVSHEARSQDQPDLVDLTATAYLDSVRKLEANIGNLREFDSRLSFGPFDTAGVLTSALVYETAAFPIGSSSGGFTYFFDATSGAAVRSSPSFGPLFAERPLTSGRGKLNIGVTYLHRSFSKLEGKDLDDGSLKFFAPLNYTGTDLTADLVQSTLNLTVTSDTTTLFATYGVIDKLDVSLAVPIQHVSVDAAVTSQLFRFGPSSGIPGSDIQAGSGSRSGSASGIGDMAIRAKYNLLNAERGAVAAGVDLRLPTGDERNLLGTGRSRTKLYAAVTSKMPRLFPHANFGYTFKSELNDEDRFYFGSEFSYAAGTEYVLNPRLTLVGDIIGRSLAEEGRLQEQPSTFELVRTTSTPAVSRTVTELTYEPGLRLNSTLATIGAKFNPRSTFVISGHVLFPITNAGIKSRPTPVIGVDYSF